jgi:uncharacterized phage-like protein YoqJ
MSIILPGHNDHTLEILRDMHFRITALSEQVNFLLRTLYKENSFHVIFQRNTILREQTRRAVELEQEQYRDVKVTVPTPDYTREKITELKEKMKS